MDLVDIIRLKFPAEFNNFTAQVGDKGNGQEIVAWPEHLPEPNKDNLAGWEKEVLALYQQEQFNNINKAILLSLEEIDKKSIRALRANDADRLKQLEDEAILLRQQLIKI